MGYVMSPIRQLLYGYTYGLCVMSSLFRDPAFGAFYALTFGFVVFDHVKRANTY